MEKVVIERKYFDIACERIDVAQRQGKLFDHEPMRQHHQQDLLTA